MSISDNLKRLRRDKGWTQGELAIKSGVGMAQISKIEKNKTDPKLSTIYQLINAMGCSADALLIDTEKSNIDSVIAVALERVKQLGEDDKKVLLTIIDKYCIATSLQQMADRKVFFGLNIHLDGSTPEMIKKSE
ncbi:MULTISPECIES: helix-turn-helix domain-containing protein [unclassified Erwinia]|uniref:helix-turn-helix domain-containing protein n=1 Tax=unclassified Erwinia TaxID=2622719 RepID=UPI000C17534F|nr:MULTISPECIES: helix-turn-helix transcriptional regulator [unclassified Erwinia]PIJ48495.1 hypothetical protein BV501_16820 [Erwinia sp. OAMSP11]PIJ78767.1 hypothetical protein BLD47_16760 [Erwinia sp. OLCASP19]PIJ80112.1 hypothetical protein BLD46_16010 [Erwinia sp. OLMTSP26]PIJ82181.1 hypothetical protein BLD49_15685 [Erwinia sp. OLMDSP33]PIJ88968.1 hypothetical protein BL249_17555 [Erwinia sp. OLFS4]